MENSLHQCGVAAKELLVLHWWRLLTWAATAVSATAAFGWRIRRPIMNFLYARALKWWAATGMAAAQQKQAVVWPHPYSLNFYPDADAPRLVIFLRIANAQPLDIKFRWSKISLGFTGSGPDAVIVTRTDLQWHAIPSWSAGELIRYDISVTSAEAAGLRGLFGNGTISAQQVQVTGDFQVPSPNSPASAFPRSPWTCWWAG